MDFVIFKKTFSKNALRGVRKVCSPTEAGETKNGENIEEKLWEGDKNWYEAKIDSRLNNYLVPP